MSNINLSIEFKILTDIDSRQITAFDNSHILSGPEGGMGNINIITIMII